MDSFTKRPDEVLDYDALFAKWLPVGDTIASAVAVLDPTTTGLAINSVAATSGAVKVWISGGADGDQAVVKVTATTVGTRVKDHWFKIRVKD